MTLERITAYAEDFIKNTAKANTITVDPVYLHTTGITMDAIDDVVDNYAATTNDKLTRDHGVLRMLVDTITADRDITTDKAVEQIAREYVQTYNDIDAAILAGIEATLDDDASRARYTERALDAMLFREALEYPGVKHGTGRITHRVSFCNEVKRLMEERGITATLGSLDEYSPLTEEMLHYGNDVTVPAWIAPLQEDNHNREGGEVGADVSTLIDGYEYDVDIADDVLSDSVRSLLASQGYTQTQCVDEAFANRAFVKSLRDEILEMSGQMSQIAFLIARCAVPVASFDAIMRGRTDGLLIPGATEGEPGATVGLFDPVCGSGSLLGIELERDWIVPFTAADIIASFGGFHPDHDAIRGGYGYAPSDVYGADYDLREARAVRLPDMHSADPRDEEHENKA